MYVGINRDSGKERSRTPDLCIMTTAQWVIVKAEKTKADVLRTAPLLVVEIFSPSSKKQTTKLKSKSIRLLELLSIGL